MGRWLIWIGAVLVLLAGAAVYVLGFWTLRDPHPVPVRPRGVLAITGARVVVSPDGPVMERGTVLVPHGRIAAVGQGVGVPAGRR